MVLDISNSNAFSDIDGADGAFSALGTKRKAYSTIGALCRCGSSRGDCACWVAEAINAVRSNCRSESRELISTPSIVLSKYAARFDGDSVTQLANAARLAGLLKEGSRHHSCASRKLTTTFSGALSILPLDPQIPA